MRCLSVTWFLALPLFALGCSRGGDGPGPATLGPEYDAYEAAVRQHAASVRPPDGRRAVIYLALEEGDPPAAFWERFRGDTVGVEPRESYREGNRGVFAVFLSLGIWEWQGPDRVRLKAFARNESERPRCGTPWPIVVARRGDRWDVVP